ncbi:uncharacterized protein LOC113561251 [Rhopalosiphum maidis]|uniref:uncharacterized protein LOC113561251 n=1 Tax=Rhopalosiphum maidis TaxID=43146 RepID=UPI000EFE973B|nr:uncharacterized protein LOC113561251 [Rhopalosiphum maidis]
MSGVDDIKDNAQLCFTWSCDQATLSPLSVRPAAVFILSIFYYYPLILTQDAKPVVCFLAGEMWNSRGTGYVFNVNELPEPCDIFIVGQFPMDLGDDVGIIKQDENAMISLIESNKIVYLRIGFKYQQDWYSILYPEDANQVKTQKFDLIVNFLKKHNIRGLFMWFPFLLDGDIPNVSQKLSDFVTSIKNEVDGLKVGIEFYAFDQISNKTRIDFTLINEVIDHFVIDLTNLNACDENSKKYGLDPISSETMLSIDTITNIVTKSTVDQSKLFAKIQASVIKPSDLVEKGALTITTYSKYCDDQEDTSRWCGNPSKLSYDQGAYVAQFYSGLFIENLDADDFLCKCGCKKFPVTNLIIDGWKKCDFTTCPKLDKKAI